jgi:hypothetical protein
LSVVSVMVVCSSNVTVMVARLMERVGTKREQESSKVGGRWDSLTLLSSWWGRPSTGLKAGLGLTDSKIDRHRICAQVGCERRFSLLNPCKK